MSKMLIDIKLYANIQFLKLLTDSLQNTNFIHTMKDDRKIAFVEITLLSLTHSVMGPGSREQLHGSSGKVYTG